jgi:hypothetical protein
MIQNNHKLSAGSFRPLTVSAVPLSHPRFCYMANDAGKNLLLFIETCGEMGSAIDAPARNETLIPIIGNSLPKRKLERPPLLVVDPTATTGHEAAIRC